MVSRDQIKAVAQKLYIAAKQYPRRNLSAKDLKGLGIQLFGLDLFSDNSSKICTPWPRESFEGVYCQVPEDCKPTIPKDNNNGDSDGRYISQYHRARACAGCLQGYFDLTTEDDYLCEQRKWWIYGGEVSQLTMTHPSPFDEQHWSMSHFLQIRDHGQHHIGTFLVDDREPTEPLSQSELMTALHMINNGMERSRSASDIPVFLYSVAYTKARIIHANFVGTTLCIRKSQYIDVYNGKEEDLKLYLRWMLNDPIGANTDMIKDKPDRWDAPPPGARRYPIIGWMNP